MTVRCSARRHRGVRRASAPSRSCRCPTGRPTERRRSACADRSDRRARCGSPGPPPRAHAAGRRRARSIASCRLSTVRISSDCMRPAGMPVQPSTISAIACASTTGKISGRSPCNARSAALAVGELRDARLPCRRHWPGPRSPRATPRSSSASPFSCCPRASSAFSSSSALRPLLVEFGAARGMVGAGRGLAIEDRHLGVDHRDAALAVLDRRRDRRLAHRHPRAGGVDQRHRLVRQLAARDVARREPHRLADRLVEDADV